MLEIYNHEVRRACEWTRMRRDVLPEVVRHVLTGVGYGGGYISWCDLTEDTADAVIEREVAYFRDLGVDFEWKYYDYDRPADLPQRLLARGFTRGEPEALMVAHLDDLPAEYWTMDISAVTRVTAPGVVDEIVRMENEVWDREISGFAAGLKYDLEHNPQDVSVFVIWQDGRVVSAAWTFYLANTTFAGMFGGSTLREYRRRGYYTALLAARAREARLRGYSFLQVDASPNSQPILAKHGFRCLGYSTPYEWEPDGSVVSKENSMYVVNLAEKLALFHEHWSPRIVGELNDSFVKLAKLQGEFLWHKHDDEDELFLVVKGRLRIRLRDRELVVREGEFAIIPRGVEHCPVAAEEVHVLLLEPKSTRNTGNVQNERTVDPPRM